MSDLSSTIVLVVASTDSGARRTTAYLREKCTASVLSCGSDLDQAIRAMKELPVRAVVASSGGGGRLLGLRLERLAAAARSERVPVILYGVSERQKRALVGDGYESVWMLGEQPTDRFWAVLDACLETDRR